MHINCLRLHIFIESSSRNPSTGLLYCTAFEIQYYLTLAIDCCATQHLYNAAWIIDSTISDHLSPVFSLPPLL